MKLRTKSTLRRQTAKKITAKKRGVRATTAKSGDKKSTQRAIAMVKLAGITLRLKEQNNHLQGLYAELGKIVYEQRIHRSVRAGRRGSTAMEGIVEKIKEMRKNMDRMEREARLLRSVV
jgi:hypothetical protein